MNQQLENARAAYKEFALRVHKVYHNGYIQNNNGDFSVCELCRQQRAVLGELNDTDVFIYKMDGRIPDPVFK